MGYLTHGRAVSWLVKSSRPSPDSVILLDWTGLDFEVGSSPVQCTGLGAPGAPMQIQFSKWIRSIPHFAKRVAARFTAESILVQCCCGMYLTSITLVTASPPE
jgi:hypothetical protein